MDKRWTNRQADREKKRKRHRETKGTEERTTCLKFAEKGNKRLSFERTHFISFHGFERESNIEIHTDGRARSRASV